MCRSFSRIVDRMAAQAAAKRSRILKHMKSKRIRQNFEEPEVRDPAMTCATTCLRLDTSSTLQAAPRACAWPEYVDCAPVLEEFKSTAA